MARGYFRGLVWLRTETFDAGSPAAFGFAITCVGIAALADLALSNFANDITPSIAFYPAIFISALVGGFRPGIVAVIFSAIMLWWILDSQYFGPHAVNDIVNRGLYVIAGILTIWIAEKFRNAGNRDRQVAERARSSSAAASAQMTSASDTVHSLSVKLYRLWHNHLRSSWLAPYSFAAACIAVATLLRFGIGWYGENILPFACYYPAILIVTWVVGIEAAFFAVALSLIVVGWAFYPPHYVFDVPTRSQVISFCFFIIASAGAVWLAENYRRIVLRVRTNDVVMLEFIAPIVVSLAAVLLTTMVLLIVETYLEAEHLALAYLLPTTLVAMRYGSTLAFLASFASGLAAAYFVFPPKFSLYIASPLHVAELGFFILLAVIASKVIAVLTSDLRDREGRAKKAQ